MVTQLYPLYQEIPLLRDTLLRVSTVLVFLRQTFPALVPRTSLITDNRNCIPFYFISFHLFNLHQLTLIHIDLFLITLVIVAQHGMLALKRPEIGNVY